MALMVPESMPSKASQGEKTLYKILRDELPDDFIVWYEPIVAGRLYPDFIILAPTFGLLIIEVKGWYPKQVISADSHNFTINFQKDGIEKTKVQQSPLRQGKNYLNNLLNQLDSYPILIQHEGNYQGQLAFPIGCGVVMSNMTVEQSREKDIYKILAEPQVVYRDEFLLWDGIGETKLIRDLRNMFTIKFPFLALTDAQISTIKGILHPEIAIRNEPTSIVTLDLRQERLAKSIGDGHRIFYGVAGSGKTLLLLSRAKLLAIHSPKERVLILCFNIVLASYLKSILHEDPNNPQFKTIEVMHFHNWAKSILKKLPNPSQITEKYDEYLGQKLLEAINALPIENKWDSILVDEAHTFDPSWFKCCVAGLKNSENGNLMIVSDGNQSLFKRPGFKWKSVGVKATGRTSSKKFYLDQNYRNTQEILSAAWTVLSNIQETSEPGNIDPTDDNEVTFPIIKPSPALRKGSRPVLHIKKTKEQQVNAVITKIQELHKLGYAPTDIAVLYKFARDENEKPMLEGMINQLINLRLNSYWITKDRAAGINFAIQVPGVRIVTTLSSLGLEFKAVLILWVEQFFDCLSPDVEKATLARKQLYVAMTRAQDILHIFGSGNSRLLEELKQSGKFEIQQE